MALKVPKELQKKWEAKLKAEGLEALTTYSRDETRRRRNQERLLSLTPAQVRARQTYYSRANKFLRRIELAHAIWSLHCDGRGRPDIAAFLSVPEKVVRLVLERLMDISGLQVAREN